MNEIWKDIQDYNGDYQVSNFGRIRSFKNNKEVVLKPRKSGYGYLRVVLSKNGKIKNMSVHRLVCNAFIENKNNFPVINHIDENKSNNSVENLEWTTQKENVNYGTRNNRISKKLGKQIAMFLNGEEVNRFDSATEVAKLFGYNQSNIAMCCNGKRNMAHGYQWKYI